MLSELTSLLGLEGLLNVQVRRLSLGERMKMELVGALLRSPLLVFLDEPTIGLDVVTQRRLHEFLGETARLSGCSPRSTRFFKARPLPGAPRHYIPRSRSEGRQVPCLVEAPATPSGTVSALGGQLSP
ncbi:MAG: ATP-binding cassette domain-containing protein [Bacillota bacterium]